MRYGPQRGITLKVECLGIFEIIFEKSSGHESENQERTMYGNAGGLKFLETVLLILPTRRTRTYFSLKFCHFYSF
jgi:hypothetical protein